MTQKITALPKTKRRTSVPASRLAQVAKELNWDKKRLLGALAAVDNIEIRLRKYCGRDKESMAANLRLAKGFLSSATGLWDNAASEIRATVKKELDKERN